EAWTFDIHLYTDAAANSLLSPAKNPLYNEISPQFKVPLNTDGTQIEPARLTIPTAHTPLTVGDIRAGTISVQGQLSALDDLSAPAVASASIPKGTSKHCSTILERFNEIPEFVPNPAKAADDQAVEKVGARLYSFGLVSLRRGAAAVPEPVLTSVSTTEGPVAGGTEVLIFGRGLGWVETVEFGRDGKALAKANVLDGNNEFAVRVRSPKVDTPGPVNIRITTATGKAAVLKNAFTYKANEETVSLFLGLIVALIGIFSGGKGGSGGGPCFIATAAYGTSLEGDIEVLRTVRDTYLLNNAVGTAFVDAYYTVSPGLAGAVAKSPLLSALVRIALVPLIALCRLVLAMPHFVFGAIMLSMVGVAVRRVRRRLRKT
ncbi:MAG: IPT/TIG domain-containing protein, partial [Candidatus Hydrogenedentota bacterium]